MPSQAQATTFQDIWARLEGLMDHRWKKDGITLIETSVPGGFLAAWADELGIFLETLADIAETNDPRLADGDPLDRECADFLVPVESWWDDARKLWGLLLEFRILASKGTIPDIQRVVSWFVFGDDDHTDEVEIVNNVCQVCGYEEPAFYTINLPPDLVDLDVPAFEFDETEDDEIRSDAERGFDSGIWGFDESYAGLRVLDTIIRATLAGVRINAQIIGSFAFDDSDDDTIREGDSGFDEGRWEGPLLSLLRDMTMESGITLEQAAEYHVCAAQQQYWEVDVEWGNVEPELMEFDATDDDVARADSLRGFDSGIWDDEEEV